MSTRNRLAFALLLAVQCGISFAQNDARLARGKYLVESVVACGNCHSARDSKGEPDFSRGLSGGMVFNAPPFKAVAPNITPDPETGIGKWTDAQLAKAIREGVKPDGSVIGPPMPIEMYRHLSDDDLAAIVAYIKAQPPVKHAMAESTYNIPLPPNYGPAVKHIQAPPSAKTVKYGEYLANIGHCMECHTPRDKTGRLMTTRLGAGGEIFKGPWGTSISRNLTADESGLKNWTDAQIATAIRGTDRSGAHLKPPMAFAWYTHINDKDMAALIAYLRTLKPQTFGGGVPSEVTISFEP